MSPIIPAYTIALHPVFADMALDELIERHKHTIEKNNWDRDRIETIVSNLRILSDASKMQVVTADKGSGEIPEREGCVYINPEAWMIEDLLSEWSTEI